MEKKASYSQSNQDSSPFTPIAIVGIETLFPGSTTNEEFWRNIFEGKDLITTVPSDHWLIEDYYDPNARVPAKVYVTRGGFIPAIDFDPIEFGIPPNNLSSIDPTQLISLILSKRLLSQVHSVHEGKVKRENISVIIGTAVSTQLITHMSGQLYKPHWVKAMREAGLPEDQVQDIADRIIRTYPEWTESTFPGLLPNVIAGRIANRLDLKGTNCVVDAACATSLAGLLMGVQALQCHTTDLVLTGGADAFNDIFMFHCFSKTGALSLSDDCRPFSDKSDGTLLGEGFGFFALRRLEEAERDGDQIYAVIKSIGSSSDGKGLSIYAPLAKGQAIAIRRAQQLAGCSPQEIELIEAHGTGTTVGDLTEFDGLCEVFGEENKEKEWCALGSIKSQIGHTKAAAGSASLFKAVMALHHKVLPPIIKVDKPLNNRDFESSPFYLNTHSRPWIHDKNSLRKAGVSSFGFGGTNYHVVVEEYRGNTSPKRFSTSPIELILLSGENWADLKGQAELYMSMQASLSGLAKKSQAAFKSIHPYRLALIVSQNGDLHALISKALERINRAPSQSFSLPYEMYYHVGASSSLPLAFLFPGQGSQYLNMGNDLAMEFEESRRVWDLSLDFAFDDSTPLHRVVFPPPTFSDERKKELENRLKQTEWAQPAIGLVSASQLTLLQKIGITPSAVAGHSYGEVAALYAAGAITSFADFLRISQKRGELMASVSSASSLKGAMTVAFCSLSQAKAILQASRLRVTLANINGPKQVVFSGETNQIDALENILKTDEIRFHRLSVSNAFHSPLVEPCVEPFLNFLKTIPISSPRIPVYSNTTGNIYPSSPEQIRLQLARQLASTVLFQEQIEKMYQQGIRIFIEVGPQSILTNLVKTCLENKDYIILPLDIKGKNGVSEFWNGLGILAAAGVKIDFDRLWDEFVEPKAQLDEKKLSKVAVKINGNLYGKIYPPKEGASGRPLPNTEAPIKSPLLCVEAEPIQHEGLPAMAQSDKEENIKKHSQDQRDASEESTPAWLKTFQELQNSAFTAQQQFQQALTESHRSFLEFTKAALYEIGRVASGEKIEASNQSRPSEIITQHKEISSFYPSSPAQSRLEDISTTTKPEEFFAPPRESTKPTPSKVMKAPPEAEFIEPPSKSFASRQTAEKVAPKIEEEPISEENKQLVFEVIAEKTGYPIDVLDINMELETELGIDSIKRVEILSALTEKIPSLQEQDRATLTQLRTIKEILQAMQKAAPVSKKKG